MYAHSVSDTVHLVPDRPLSLASVGGSRHFVNIETLPVPLRDSLITEVSQWFVLNLELFLNPTWIKLLAVHVYANPRC